MQQKFGYPTSLVMPGCYEIEDHFYIKVLNAQLHAMVSYFMPYALASGCGKVIISDIIEPRLDFAAKYGLMPVNI